MKPTSTLSSDISDDELKLALHDKTFVMQLSIVRLIRNGLVLFRFIQIDSTLQ